MKNKYHNMMMHAYDRNQNKISGCSCGYMLIAVMCYVFVEYLSIGIGLRRIILTAINFNCTGF